MSESTGDGEASSSGDKLTPASTVSSLLQNIMDLDVAATLGLYDDPATSLGMALDTSGLQDVVLDMSGSHLLPAAPPPSQGITMAVTPPPPDVLPQTSIVSPSSFLTSTALSSASRTAPVMSLESPSNSSISTGAMAGVTSDGREESADLYSSEESGRARSEIMDAVLTLSTNQSQETPSAQGVSKLSSGVASPADLIQPTETVDAPVVAGTPLPSSVLAALGIPAPQEEGVVNMEVECETIEKKSVTPDIVVESVIGGEEEVMSPHVAVGSELLVPTDPATGSALSLPVVPPIASSISGILTAESTCSSTLPVTTPTSASLSESSQAVSAKLSTATSAVSSVSSSSTSSLQPPPTSGQTLSSTQLTSTSIQLSTSLQSSLLASSQPSPSVTSTPASQPPQSQPTLSLPATSQPSPSTTSTPPKPTTSQPTLPQPTTSQPSPSTTSSPATTASSTPNSDSTPKGLNLPLLQFLQVNFPNLQLDNFQDIYQVNALLTHALQQQQQMQQQIKQTAQQLQESRQQLKQKQGAALGTSVATSSLSKLASPSSKLGGPAVGTSAGGGVRGVQVGSASSTSMASSSPAIKSPAVRLGGGSLTASPATRLTGSAIAAGGRKTITLPGAGSPINLGGGAVGSKGTVINTLATKLGSKASTGTMTTSFKKAQSPVAKAKSPQPPSPSSAVATTVGKGLTVSEADLSGVNRTPVFARILANMKQQQKLISSVAAATKGSSPTSTSSLVVGNSPLVLGGGVAKQSLVQATVPQFPSPLHHTASSTGVVSSAVKMSARTAAKNASNRTLIEHEEAESMDVDVVGGGTCVMVELPPHLRDHTYSHYNPEEGGKTTVLGRPRAIRVTSSIPPSRVSYAPKVSESGMISSSARIVIQ